MFNITLHTYVYVYIQLCTCVSSYCTTNLSVKSIICLWIVIKGTRYYISLWVQGNFILRIYMFIYTSTHTPMYIHCISTCVCLCGTFLRIAYNVNTIVYMQTIIIAFVNAFQFSTERSFISTSIGEEMYMNVSSIRLQWNRENIHIYVYV